MRNLTQFTVLLLYIMSMSFTSFSQTNYKDLKKQQKEMKNQLKERYGYSSVSVKYVDGMPNYFYYLIEKKNGNKKVYGIVNSDGKVIFEPKYDSYLIHGAIKDKGYYDYTLPEISGGTTTVTLYNHPVPIHILLSEGDKFHIYYLDGTPIATDIEGNARTLGSWIFVNSQKIYARFINGRQKVMAVNNETKNMGLLTWDGVQLIKNENFLFMITSHSGKDRNLCNVFNNNNKTGGFCLEDPTLIAPTEFSEFGYDNDIHKFKVKLGAADKWEIFDPDKGYSFVPKNDGERFYQAHDYENCIKFYADQGIDDPDAKLYAALSMYTIGYNRIINLSNHIQNSANKLNNYNYDEIYNILNDAKTVSETGKIQDPDRAEQFNDVINNCDLRLSELNTLNAQLPPSFGEALTNAFLNALTNGLMNAAYRSIDRLTESSFTSTSSTNNRQTSIKSGYANNSTYSSSSSASGNSNIGAPIEKRKEKCKACGGSGMWVDERISGDEKWCDICKRNRKPHTHKQCGSCKGAGVK